MHIRSITAIRIAALLLPALWLSSLVSADEQGTFFQKVAVSRNPKFLVSGVTMEQLLQYEIVSKLEVRPSQGAGALTVKQTIVSGRLIKADPLSQSSYAEALKKIAGTTLRYELNDSNEVISFRGGKASRTAIAIDKLSIEKLLDNKGFMLTSLIDDDGWKELATLTFFQPTPQQRQWKTQFHHDWAPLGSWSGETTFAVGRKRGKWQLYGYQHDMKYRAPGEKKAVAKRDEGGGKGEPGKGEPGKGEPGKSEVGDEKASATPGIGGLPFSLKGADFTPLKSGGQIVYDTAKGRIESAEELFHVRGVVAATVLGQESRIQVEEKQMFKILLNDQNVWSQ